MTDHVVGIDLGTTHSLVGVVDGGRVRLLEDEDGAVLLPSVVGRSPEGEILVGRRARNRRLLDPAGTVRSIKRQMGSDARVRIGDEELSPPEVSALILGALADRAERHLGERPARAVVTVPAYFNEHQRQATIDAGEIAGLHIERLVNEPTAAALSHQSGAEELVLVYDLGGGTFDVSILERDEDFLEVRASHGDTQLGGDDVDAALLERVLEQLGPEAEIVRGDPRAMTRLSEAVERAKIALTEKAEAALHEPFLAGEGARAVNLERTLSRDDLDAVVRPLVERTLACIDAALRAARVAPADLDRIVLVGGASQMPIVRAMVQDHLGRPAQLADAPDRAVAHGATLLAGRVAGAEVDEVLVDITPFTLAAGTLAPDPAAEHLLASAVISRGAVVPARETATYFTAWEDQEAIELPIAQGESPVFEDNTELGQLMIEGLPPSPVNSPVDVVFDLDLSGVLHVSATHRPSGKSADITIAHGPARLTEQRRQSARARFERLRGVTGETPRPDDEPDEADMRLARSLLRRARKALEGELPDAPRAALEDAVARLEGALEEGGEVEEAVEALTDALYEVS